jgi:hypothetical protein
MNYDNFMAFIKAYPETRELQFIEMSGKESRYRNYNLNSRHILNFPEGSGVGTMILHSMTDIYKVSQLEYYKDLARELKIEDTQGLFESITYSSCKKDKMGKVSLNTTSKKWLDKMLQFVVSNYTELKYGISKKSPRRNSKQYKDKLTWIIQTERLSRGENKNFKEVFDLTSDIYMTIINKRCSPSLDKADKKFLLHQIESSLIKINAIGGV